MLPATTELARKERSIAHYGLAVICAAAITVSLFWLMHRLIKLGDKAKLDKSKRVKIMDFVRLRQTPQVSAEDEVLPDRPQDESADPPEMDISTSAGSASNSMKAIAVSEVAADSVPMAAEIDLAGGPTMMSAPSDSMAVPLVRVQPFYPREAADQRLEGWVEVAFTISGTGSVKDARVVGSSATVFEQAALRAIRRWKYKPKIVGGKRIETPNQRARLRFRLED